MKALAIVKPQKGARVHGTLARWEYKEETRNGKLVTCRVRMTIRGDQQMAGVSFVATDLYALVPKAEKARLLQVIDAAEDCSVYKIRVKLSLWKHDPCVENDDVYTRALDW
jgi:hypothetical protein